jgi:hypothetical protein
MRHRGLVARLAPPPSWARSTSASRQRAPHVPSVAAQPDPGAAQHVSDGPSSRPRPGWATGGYSRPSPAARTGKPPRAAMAGSTPDAANIPRSPHGELSPSAVPRQAAIRPLPRCRPSGPHEGTMKNTRRSHADGPAHLRRSGSGGSGTSCSVTDSASFRATFPPWIALKRPVPSAAARPDGTAALQNSA